MSNTTADPHLLAEEILAAIFHFARETGKGKFRGHDYKIQEIFQELAAKHPILKTYFPVSPEGPTPYSPYLNDSISRLQLAGLLSRQNPDYQVVILNPTTHVFFQRNVEEKLEEDELTEIRQVGEEFAEMVGEA